ncbi:putative peptidoglycan muropeptide transporter SLC46 isoform X2 [Osmia lignaria lignaria]|uniref:putative peptidoglycan muropeptide transporter SLC46 isoform X2 n=1 Tax=Osmia lignaria lignaria TaxID=1437193 RepID=UPI001478A375|nr:proton-coupled folate transporter isoform X2 [Osmia lignaria]
MKQQGDSEMTHRKWRKYFEWVDKVSVEPTMWLYMMAFMITSVVEQAFFVYKSCRVDHGYSEEVCARLNDNETIKAKVQVTVSEFHQWNNIAGHVVPIILALFFGNWSDRRGRKLPMILGLLGKFVYSFMVVINSMVDSWNLNTVVYTASLPMGMLGGDVAIFGSCFAYISDISSVQQRTLRITILDIVYLSTMPTGVALGSYLYTKVANSSYSIMFTINASLLALAIIYSIIRLKWQTLPQQQPLSGTNLLTDFFDKKHVVATMKTMTRRRPNHGKLRLWLLLTIMMLYTFQRDEKPMSFLYTQLKFKWDVAKFSDFKTFQSTTFVLAMLIGVPVMSKLMGIKDTIIVAIGAIAHAAGRVLFVLANVPELFYVGAAVAALGPVVAPVLRSMTSKLVPVEERGKVFAMLSVCDNAVPLFSGILYSQLYNATINTAPSSIYWLTFFTQILVLLLILIIHFFMRNDLQLEEQEFTNTETDCRSLSSTVETDKSNSNEEKY